MLKARAEKGVDVPWEPTRGGGGGEGGDCAWGEFDFKFPTVSPPQTAIRIPPEGFFRGCARNTSVCVMAKAALSTLRRPCPGAHTPACVWACVQAHTHTPSCAPVY